MSFTFAVKAQKAYKFNEATNPRWDIGEVLNVYDFRDELRKLTDAKGFILVFGKRGKSLRYAEDVKRFLLFSKINSERILTGYGGESENRKMELWIVPKDAETPQSVKVNYEKPTVFDDYPFLCEGCELGRKTALEIFAKELKDFPQTKAYIVIYPSKSENSTIKNRQQAEKKAAVEKRFLNRLGIKNSRITMIIGDYETYECSELWIVPLNSELPKSALQKSDTSND